MNDEHQTFLSLHPSEMAVFRGACDIFAGYIASGNTGDEYLNKAVSEAIQIAVAVERKVDSDDEPDAAV